MTFVRRFTSDPGDEVIEQIEGIVLISRDPPAQIQGAFSGTVLLVGEFEDGPFAPTEIENGGDLLTNFGGFGFTYGGLASCNPCARGRKADGATSFEYWNGNAFVWLSQKKFGGLIVCRVDTSVGAVEFTRLPAIVGNNQTTWALADSDGIEIQLEGSQGGAGFTAAVADLLSADGTYPTTFAGGETMNVTIDEGTDQQIGPIDIVFTSGDTAHTDVINRINATLGYTAATAATLKTHLKGRVGGTGGSVKVNSVSVPLVTTATGFSPGTTLGTGNVSNIGAVTLLEVKAIVEAGVPGTRVDRDNDGNIRIAATTGDRIYIIEQIGSASALGFTSLLESSEPSGFALLTTNAGTYPNGFVGGETLSLGYDDAPNFVVNFQAGDTTRAAVISRINEAAGYAMTSANATSTKIDFAGRVTGGQLRVISASDPSVLTALGLDVLTITAMAHGAESIPAGTRVRNASAVEWVTTQTTTIDPNDPGPYSIKVRPGLDDGTVGSTSANTATVLPTSPGASAWSATNPSGLSAALTESAIDSAYDDAFARTLAQSSVAKLANGVFAARQSNAVRNALRANGLTASGSGMTGRVSVIRPPLGTTRAVAKSGMAQPGVGRYRSANNGYAYPGLQIRIPQIAARGLSGGAGFTADGVVDVGSDVLVATLMSQLPPEENIGQQTDIPTWALGLEAGNADVQNMDIDDYIAFKRAGIMAPVFDEGCQIQSAVTTVDPTISPELADFARQRFEYFLQDSIKQRLKAFNKKKMTAQRRADCLGEINGFMAGLLSANNPAAQRIDSYLIDAKSGNSKNSLARGQFRIILRCRMLPDMKFIVLETIVGTNVDTTVNVLAQAA